MTLFDYMKRSPERLARSITYPYEMETLPGNNNWQTYYTSPLIDNFYPTRKEAEKATLDELNKELEFE